MDDEYAGKKPAAGEEPLIGKPLNLNFRKCNHR